MTGIAIDATIGFAIAAIAFAIFVTAFAIFVTARIAFDKPRNVDTINVESFESRVTVLEDHVATILELASGLVADYERHLAATERKGDHV
jgi:hypothetical protein